MSRPLLKVNCDACGKQFNTKSPNRQPVLCRRCVWARRDEKKECLGCHKLFTPAAPRHKYCGNVNQEGSCSWKNYRALLKKWRASERGQEYHRKYFKEYMEDAEHKTRQVFYMQQWRRRYPERYKLAKQRENARRVKKNRDARALLAAANKLATAQQKPQVLTDADRLLNAANNLEKFIKKPNKVLAQKLIDYSPEQIDRLSREGRI